MASNMRATIPFDDYNKPRVVLTMKAKSYREAAEALDAAREALEQFKVTTPKVEFNVEVTDNEIPDLVDNDVN